MGNAREFNVNLPSRTFAIIKRRMMIQLEAGLHSIKGLEFDEAKTAAFFVVVLLVGCDAHGDGGDFGEVCCYRFCGGGVGEVSFFYYYYH